MLVFAILFHNVTPALYRWPGAWQMQQIRLLLSARHHPTALHCSWEELQAHVGYIAAASLLRTIMIKSAVPSEIDARDRGFWSLVARRLVPCGVIERCDRVWAQLVII
jgi:hypothetical protein